VVQGVVGLQSVAGWCSNTERRGVLNCLYVHLHIFVRVCACMDVCVPGFAFTCTCVCGRECIAECWCSLLQ